ncbi:MAG TPA: hypothetical protein VFI91_05630 [Longimicrobiaceae bacterium]|nr:hypothetical protein [Longimicrobiaceae bacterium]
MKISDVLTHILGAGLLMGITACTNNTPPPPSTVCTLIGCENGLAVEIAGERTGAVDVTVETAGQDARTFECADPNQPCRNFFGGFMPSEVTVTVRASDGSVSTESFTPTYETTYPNGPDCPPGCEQATVTVEV